MSIKFTNLKISRARTIRPDGYRFPEGLNSGTPKDIDHETVPFSTGGTVTYTPTKVVHTFTGTGELRTFFTTNYEQGNLYEYIDSLDPLTADILLVGGGGSGGTGTQNPPNPGHYHGGGGGAGGLVYTSGLSISKNQPYIVVVGGGGNGAYGSGTPSAFGNNVVGFPTHPFAGADCQTRPQGYNGAGYKAPNSPGEAGSIISLGGGVGGAMNHHGSPGGSGGGSGRSPTNPEPGQGVSGQGNNGFAGGGPGGGAAPNPTTVPGVPADQQNEACNGLEYSISGSPVYYAGGGGGAPHQGSCNGIPGGYGGGGKGENAHSCIPQGISMPASDKAGQINRGGGGGGSGVGSAGGTGGSGIVVIAIDKTTQISGFDIN